ncbi:GntR family transcriptional regulator [Mariluticola halotolerans]|uniref:GntR family transcriptional regulator n=1 Tax=Mariluticola halotolerans TaxID=2909283 RepID=UPI0026E3530C|nr:GntR family transcriptional regulator [Mariluticola halotolerans]UJQ93418.1 GntR family transcriptional regulator [Mariluticola halotolerans]
METPALLAHLKTAVTRADIALPLHKRLKSALEELITDNRLKPGAALPGERALAEAVNLSRVTVRKAIELLVEEGYLLRRHGARTEVRSRVEKSMSTLTSFSEDMVARGLNPGCIWLNKKVSRPSPTEMMALGISSDTQVIRMTRIRVADGTPMALEISTVPVKFLPSPDLVGDSLYEALDKLGAMPERAIQRMRSRLASAYDAEHLKCDIGSPMLIMERRCFLADGQIVELSESRYVGDIYDFVLELNR